MFLGARGATPVDRARLTHVLLALASLAAENTVAECEINPLRDIKSVDFDLIVSDLGQVEKRLERLEKDLKKMKTAELERENDLIQRAKTHLEKELPLREMEITADDEKRIRGFMFLSQKPMLYVLNVNESATLGEDLEHAVEKYKLAEVASRPGAGATAVCGRVEAELADMSDEDAAEFLSSYGLKESGLVRLIRKPYELLGLISFFTGERAGTLPSVRKETTDSKSGRRTTAHVTRISR